MLIVIRNGTKLSSKAKFVIKFFQRSNSKILYVFKSENATFFEEWSCNVVHLSSSIHGLFLYYLLMFLKSPKDNRDGLMARLSLIKRKNVLVGEGFLSILSRTLYLHLGASARADNLKEFLKKLPEPNIFLIDEFVSLNCLDLKKLGDFGQVIYVSSDIAQNRFGFGDNFVTKTLMFRLERDSIFHFDLIIACSEMEKLKYIEMGATRAVCYPNIYPTKDFEPCKKDETPSISIVLKEHWGPMAEASLEKIFNALTIINREIKVYMIGIRPTMVPKNVKLEYRNFIPTKLEYLRLLSKSWIGINIGIHKAGTNERKYDYAEAGLIVFSDPVGARGDLIPHEYTYVDNYDLVAKVEQLFEFGSVCVSEMGMENRKAVLSIAKKGKQRLDYLLKLKNIT
jgi:hypothetical protein